jgi:hypothetical protein
MAAGVDGITSAVDDSGGGREFHRRLQDWRLDRSLFIVVCIVLSILMLVLCLGLYVQYDTYRDAIASGGTAGGTIDHASTISYARALDFAIAKTTALTMGFVLIFLGALYVLRVGEAEYGLTVGNSAVKSSLQTSSPGLVMVTLGVALTSVVLNTKSAIEYSGAAQIAAPGSATIDMARHGAAAPPPAPQSMPQAPVLSRSPPHLSPGPSDRSSP